jgi:Uma2 family endonuclease
MDDSTLHFDRREKLRMYARAGIPEYWMVNVRAKQIEIHRDPQGETYPVVFTAGELLG